MRPGIVALLLVAGGLVGACGPEPAAAHFEVVSTGWECYGPGLSEECDIYGIFRNVGGDGTAEVTFIAKRETFTLDPPPYPTRRTFTPDPGEWLRVCETTIPRTRSRDSVRVACHSPQVPLHYPPTSSAQVTNPDGTVTKGGSKP